MSRRPFTPKVVTANHLLSGEVVYLSPEDTWVTALPEAEVIEDEAHAQLRLLDGEVRSHEVVGVYLADVASGTEGTRPVHFREAFRATGPSNYPHGKQATLEAL